MPEDLSAAGACETRLLRWSRCTYLPRDRAGLRSRSIKPLVPAKVKDYYKSEYSAASNSYFSQSGTLQGQWHCQLAADFGLTGSVEAQAFDRVADGEAPSQGSNSFGIEIPISREKERKLRAALLGDLTFNAPKTVSLTALVEEDECVRKAHLQMLNFGEINQPRLSTKPHARSRLSSWRTSNAGK